MRYPKNQTNIDLNSSEQLQTERTELAKEENMPAYVIFHDKTLQKIATRFPQTVESLRQIHGVGSRKAEKYADAFLPIICSYCQEQGFMDENLSQTKKETENQDISSRSTYNKANKAIRNT